MACGNNMISRSGLQSGPTALTHPSQGPAHVDTVARQQVVEASRQADRQVDQAKSAVQRATSESALRSAVRDAEKALDSARRAGGDKSARDALRSLEREVDQLKKDAIRRHSDLAADEQRERTQQQQAIAFARDHLSPMQLGVPPRVAQQSAADVAMVGLARSLPAYAEHVDRRAAAPHVARESWQPTVDPLPVHAELGHGQRVADVARTVNGDVAFLNQDGVPVAARFTLTSQDATPRDAWVQRRMQDLFRGTGLDAGHMGPLFAGGPHLAEFVTGQTPTFNRGGQGGFELAIEAASRDAANVEVSVVVDVSVGTVRFSHQSD